MDSINQKLFVGEKVAYWRKYGNADSVCYIAEILSLFQPDKRNPSIYKAKIFLISAPAYPKSVYDKTNRKQITVDTRSIIKIDYP